MSSDETDNEGAEGPSTDRKRKRVRRVGLVWINPELTELWDAVESYYGDTSAGWPGLNVSHARGNRPYPRISAPMRMDTKRIVLGGLPSNFYNKDWWRALAPYQQNALEAADEVEIPKLNTCATNTLPTLP